MSRSLQILLFCVVALLAACGLWLWPSRFGLWVLLFFCGVLVGPVLRLIFRDVTLIELLVVVAIIGGLILGVLPAIHQARSAARPHWQTASITLSESKKNWTVREEFIIRRQLLLNAAESLRSADAKKAANTDQPPPLDIFSGISVTTDGQQKPSTSFKQGRARFQLKRTVAVPPRHWFATTTTSIPLRQFSVELAGETLRDHNVADSVYIFAPKAIVTSTYPKEEARDDRQDGVERITLAPDFAFSEAPELRISMSPYLADVPPFSWYRYLLGEWYSMWILALIGTAVANTIIDNILKPVFRWILKTFGIPIDDGKSKDDAEPPPPDSASPNTEGTP